MINEDETFYGLPVVNFNPELGIENPTTQVYRFRSNKDDINQNFYSQFLNDPCASEVPALVIGGWNACQSRQIEDILQKIIEQLDKLPNIKALFVESFYSHKTDYATPLLEAFPKLEELRCSYGLELSQLRHKQLKKLIIEDASDDTVIESVINAKLPALEHLELWIGHEDKYYFCEFDQIKPLLEMGAFPKLRYLGLHGSEIANEIAIEIAKAPLLKQLEVLDLSMGFLTDEGAQALLNCEAIKGLKKLDLHLNIVSKAMMAKLDQLGIEVDFSKQKYDEYATLSLENTTTPFYGLPVVDFKPSLGIENPTTQIYRVQYLPQYEDIYEKQSLINKYISKEFLNDPCVSEIPALVIGDWDNRCYYTPYYAVVKQLIKQRDKLPKLKALFVREQDVSRGDRKDYTPLLKAFPKLEELGMRGCEGFYFSQLRHNHLRKLIIEPVGMYCKKIIPSIINSKLPALEQLEIYWGPQDYGDHYTLINNLIYSDNFHKLRYLGLCNSEITDEIAIEIAEAPLLKQLEVLDLSLGTLTDKGAQALLNSEHIKGLKKLDLHFHYLSTPMMKKLEGLGIEIDLSDQRNDESDFYRSIYDRYDAYIE